MMTITGNGFDATVKNFENASVKIKEGAFQGVLLALNAAFKACETMLSVEDHSLKSLAEMGHPYGFKNPQTLHDPDVLVHLQSGAYREALEKDSPRGKAGGIIEGSVHIGQSMAKMDRWIQEGTTKMRARPWMEWIKENHGEEFVDIIIARIEQAIREAARS